jgi:hypothetical protein
MLASVKKHDEPQVEATPPAPVEATRTAITAGAAPVELHQEEAQEEDALWESNAPSVEAAPETQPLEGSTVIMLSPIATQRHRKWARGVEDLPRGERWKRRLPQVCR